MEVYIILIFYDYSIGVVLVFTVSLLLRFW